MAGEKVLVTGASGFIAKHCIAELLRQGYSVQATLRDLSREEETRRAIGNAGATANQVTFVPADLMRDDGWDKAVQGCTYVLHVASPFPLKNPKDADEVIRPAREGAVRVLKAATKAGVKRVVLTSSIVAITLALAGSQTGPRVRRDRLDQSRPPRRDALRRLQDTGRARRLGVRHQHARGAGACRRQSGFRARTGARRRPFDLARGDPPDGAGRLSRCPEDRFPHQRRARRGRNARAGNDQSRPQPDSASCRPTGSCASSRSAC